nr:putative toxin-antitoxin system toxin component, PIN family [Verrucomicrobium spinosum]
MDTNILVSALRSSKGASHAILGSLPNSKFKTVLSVPLYFEYISVLKRPGLLPEEILPSDIDAVCQYFTRISHLQEIFYLWRPVLSDPKDDMVLELAVASGADYIVTQNLSDFKPATMFGIHSVRPGEFINQIGGLT